MKTTEFFRIPKPKLFSTCFLFFLCFYPIKGKTVDFEKGRDIFSLNCSACHLNGRNIIIPEKNLKKETLEANGMNSSESISYQVINGKNGMPAFGSRLTEIEVENVAFYVMQQANDSFSNP